MCVCLKMGAVCVLRVHVFSKFMLLAVVDFVFTVASFCVCVIFSVGPCVLFHQNLASCYFEFLVYLIKLLFF